MARSGLHRLRDRPGHRLPSAPGLVQQAAAELRRHSPLRRLRPLVVFPLLCRHLVLYELLLLLLVLAQCQLMPTWGECRRQRDVVEVALFCDAGVLAEPAAAVVVVVVLLLLVPHLCLLCWVQAVTAWPLEAALSGVHVC